MQFRGIFKCCPKRERSPFSSEQGDCVDKDETDVHDGNEVSPGTPASVSPSLSSSSTMTEADFTSKFRELIDCYEHDGETVTMKVRRDSSYHEYYSQYYPEDTRTKRLGESINAEKTADGRSYLTIPVEMRGITPRQLRAVHANAKRRCVEEQWTNWKGDPITPENVTLYDINTYIIKPFTEMTEKSFVESLPSTSGTQPPRWFVSHWWGESFCHTMACIETLLLDFKKNWTGVDDARGGGMTEDTPLWICAFANNQWHLDEDMATDPQQSSFTRAMRIARFRTMTILDAQAIVFTRIWCVYELFLTLVLPKDDPSLAGVWVAYTALQCKYGDEDRAAVGIIPGGAPGEWSDITSEREKPFPTDLMGKSRDIDIALAQASMQIDWTRILNSIANSENLDDTPPTTHVNYDDLNASVKASFVASLRSLLAAHQAGSDEWDLTLKILSHGKMTDRFKLDFYDFHDFSTRLSSSEAYDLMTHLPLTCTGLDISAANGEDCEGAVNGMVEWLEKKEFNSFTHLDCYKCKVGDDEKGRAAGSLLAAALSNHALSMEVLTICDTDWINSGNVSVWKLALERMPNLKKLSLVRTGLSQEEKDMLKNATHLEAKDVDIR